MRFDDRQFTAFGEELSSFVSGQGLSTCVSELRPLSFRGFDPFGNHDDLVLTSLVLFRGLPM